MLVHNYLIKHKIELLFSLMLLHGTENMILEPQCKNDKWAYQDDNLKVEGNLGILVEGDCDGIGVGP